MRIKNYESRIKNCVSPVLVVVLVVIGIVSLPNIARADPHAVFYTSTGQLQLFYNMLAALDQVDWSETMLMRERLLEQRGFGDDGTVNPPFDDEFWPLTDATKIARDFEPTESQPGPANVITRAITLEGTDLYSDYLVRMFGAEHGRRNATSELVRSLCDYGLGLKDCEFDTKDKEPEEIAEMLDYRNQAVVSNIWRWINMPFTSGVIGALSSGMEEEPLLDTAGNVIGTVPSDAEVRENLWLSDGPDRVPYAYSEDIASWRQWVKNNTATSFDRIYHERALNQLLVDTARKYISTGTEYPLRNIMFDSTGRPHPRPGPNGTISEAKQEIGTYEMMLAGRIVEAEAEEAAERILKQQDLVEEQGLLADTALVSSGRGPGRPWEVPPASPTPTPSTQPPLKELSWMITNPVAVRLADVYSLPIALALLDTSQQASALGGIDRPGDIQLVDRHTPSPTSPIYSPTSSVSGATTVAPPSPVVPAADKSPEERVLGVLDLFGDVQEGFDYDLPKEKTSPSANIIAGHLEQGAVHVLRALTAGGFRESADPQCGFTCP